MSKNLVRHIALSPDGLDEFEDQLGIERARAKIEHRVVATSWAQEHHVDDESIMRVLNGDNASYVLSLPVKERFEFMKRQAELVLGVKI